MYALQLLELLAVDLSIRTEEVQVCPKRLPFAFLLRILFGEFVAFAFVDMKNVNLHVLTSARQIRKDGRPLAKISDHVAADVAAKHGAGERILEQDLYHLFYS